MKITEEKVSKTVVGLHNCTAGIWKVDYYTNYLIVGVDNPNMSENGHWINCFSITGGRVLSGPAWDDASLSLVGSIKIEY